MAAFTLTTLATVASIAGTAAGVAGQVISYGAQKKAERLREQQMNLESTRQKRQIIRDANRQQAALAVAANAQGAEGSSSVSGLAGNVKSQGVDLTVGVNQAQQIGAGLFKANRQDAAGRLLGSFGSGLSSLAGSIADSRPRLDQNLGYEYA